MERHYRPRHARSSPLWQCVRECVDEFAAGYQQRYARTLGPRDPDREAALYAFLRCGDLSQGFLRIRCPDCDHEYLLPFTCKRRGACPTCQQRRSVDTARFIAGEVSLPVPHRHWVFTLPRVLRNVFRKEPKRLAEYFLRAPVNLRKMHWNAKTRTVLYRSSRSWRTKRNFEIFSGCDFIAALYEHIPPKSFQTVRYYGLYSNKSRGQRRRAGAARRPAAVIQVDGASPLRPRRRLWRKRILEIWGYDPLKCPCCGQEMRVKGAVLRHEQVRRHLERLGLWEPIVLTPATTPRAPPSTVRWMVAGLDGQVFDLEREQGRERMPTFRRYPWPRERFEEPVEPEADAVTDLGDGLLLEIETADPWAHDTEPVFWTD